MTLDFEHDRYDPNERVYPVGEHPLDGVRLNRKLTLGAPYQEELRGRAAKSLPGTGWDRPVGEYERPENAYELVTFEQARATDPGLRGNWDSREFYWTYVAGVGYHEQALRKIAKQTWEWFELVPEPGNPHDCDAVAIDLKGVRVGYVQASTAYGTQGDIRYLNGDNKACFVPGIVRDRESINIVLPTRNTMRSHVDDGLVAEEMARLWEALPQPIRDQIVADRFEMTPETAQAVVERRHLAPHLGFPAIPDPLRIPRTWDNDLRERRKAHQAALVAERDGNVWRLHSEGRTNKDIAGLLSISTSTVAKVLKNARSAAAEPAAPSRAASRPTDRASLPSEPDRTTRAPALRPVVPQKEGGPVVAQFTPESPRPNYPAAHPDDPARYDAQTKEVAAALEVWKKGLITVSGASRLVNYKPTKSRAVTIESPTADEILQRLNAGGQWTFEGLRDDGHTEAGNQPKTASSVAVVKSPVPHKDLGTVLRMIMRQANTEWLDRGLHVLYLAFGMLEWRDEDDTAFSSPLILVPVDLIPLGPKDVPRLAADEDEPLLNPALRVQLSRLGVELPASEDLEGLPVERQLDAVRASVDKKHGWRVQDHAVLSMFSFHKEAMYKDLVENADTILTHPIVRVLGTSDPLKQERGLGFEPIDPADIDRLAPPETTPMVLDADSSQRAAIAAAIAGHSFVMDGPPGTGKSQTIANMVGALMHAGKSVLFVSEKAAALEVVRNRLEHVGLLPYLFELHSSKTSRKEVAVELLRSLESKPRPPAGMSEQDRGAAAAHREGLSRYADGMNEKREPLGQSLHEVLGRISQLADAPHAPIPSTGTHQISADDYWTFKEIAKTLHLSWRPAEQGTSFLWRDVTAAGPLDERFFAVRNALEELRAAVDVNPALVREFELDTPSQSAKLARFLTLQHDQRPSGVPDSWLTAESHSGAEAAIAEVRACLASLVQADGAWVRTAGTPWREIEAFATAVPADQRDVGEEFETAGRTADGCQTLANQLEALATSLERMLGTSQRLAQMLGLPIPTSLRDVERVTGLVGLAAGAEKPLPEWFARGTSDTARAVSSLEASVQTLNHLESEARPYFTDAALHAPVEELLNRFRKEHKGLKKLGSAYRADKKRMAEIVANDVAVAEGIKGLEKAVAWAKASFEFQAEAQADAWVLGGYWGGRETNFEDARRALAVVDRAHEALGGVPMNGEVVTYLSSRADAGLLGPASDVENDVAGWRGSFQPGAVLQGHQSLLIDPLADAIQWLRSQAAVVGLAAGRTRAVDSALERIHTKREARLLLSLWAAAKACRDALDAKEETFRASLGSLYLGRATDLDAVELAARWAREVRELAGGALTDGRAIALGDSRPSLRLAEAKRRWDNTVEALLAAFAERRRHDLQVDLDDFSGAGELLDELEKDPGGQTEWFRYTALRDQFARLGLNDTVAACIEQRMTKEQVPGALEKALLRGWANHVLADEPRLAPGTADERSALIERYRGLDTELIHSAHSRIIHAVNARRPPYLGLGEQGVIQREGLKKKRHIPVRDLVAKTKSTVLALKPCFMMSPLSVSQYLPPDIRFDVVIFDEASQVTPSDAVNCVYRGRSLILAGDDKQLPPTSFFEKMDEGDLEQEETDVSDFQSILELAKASGALRSIPLRWHYRSADDALINFSNYKFYEGKLVVFPGPGTKKVDPAVSFRKVNGVYRRGATSDNPIEAAAVAARVIEHFKRSPKESLGVVTFSVAQASAVQDAIDKARETNRGLDEYFDKSERLHAFFVKSLESVQGDERDKIIFSIGYGPDENGKTTTNFGVLNRDKGWRRLNVAITRARNRVEVVSSVRAGDLPPSTNENVEYLRSYLDYADRGMPALAVNLGASGQGPESPFEESVLAVLTGWGFSVEPQVGSAGYRIDLGVRHPAHPGLFVLGVECDGYQYHSAPAARDRDRLREQVLRGLGWKLHRIWGTAWYRNRDGEERRLRDAIDAAMAGSRATATQTRRTAVDLGFDVVQRLDRPDWAVVYTEATVQRLNRWIDVSEPGAGFDMAAGVRQVIDHEGPVHVDVLHQRLRDAWDIGRIGAKIRDNIDSAIKHAGALRNGDFLTVPGTSVDRVRTPSEATQRRADQIHPAELSRAMRMLLAEMGSATSEQLTTATARLFGWNRTGSEIQTRLEAMLDRLLEKGEIRRVDGVLRPRS